MFYNLTSVIVSALLLCVIYIKYPDHRARDSVEMSTMQYNLYIQRISFKSHYSGGRLPHSVWKQWKNHIIVLSKYVQDIQQSCEKNNRKIPFDKKFKILATVRDSESKRFTILTLKCTILKIF